MKVTFNLTEHKESSLSKDIEKLIKKEDSKKMDKPQTYNNKGESGF